MFMKQDPTMRNALKVQLVHPLLRTSHSKSVGGGAMRPLPRARMKPGAKDNNPTVIQEQFLLMLKTCTNSPQLGRVMASLDDTLVPFDQDG